MANDVSIPVGNPSSLIAFVQNSTGGNKTTTSATLVDIDATNSIFTFVTPPSGKVLIKVTMSGSTDGNNNGFGGLREASSTVAGPLFAWNTGANANVYDALTVMPFYVTGLVPGSAHTYKVGFQVNGGSTMTVRQAATTPVTIEIWAAV